MRFIRQIERPRQSQVLYATALRTELECNEELWSVHYGEDGPGYEVLKTRMFSIEDQAMYSGEFEPWVFDEWMDQP